MPTFLAVDELKESVQRLQDSRADGSLVDFMILKRAMAINGTARVELSTQDDAFMQAVSDFVGGDDASTNGPIWFNPFGTAREVPLGYRTAKYPSNGTAVTVGHWTELVDVVGKGRARIVEFRDGYETRLASRLLVRGGDRPLPRLADAATWFYRRADLDPILHGGAEASDLVAKFVEAVGLRDAESAVLFDPGGDDQRDSGTIDGA